jgi:hypothetical protein
MVQMAAVSLTEQQKRIGRLALSEDNLSRLHS